MSTLPNPVKVVRIYKNRRTSTAYRRPDARLKALKKALAGDDLPALH